MKKPRTEGFDPNHEPERPLISSMDNFPKIEKVAPATPVTKPSSTPSTRSTIVPPTPAPAASTEQKRKIKKRHPFDIYQDQAEAFLQLSLKDRLSGGTGSQSAMVRDALDDYLEKQRKLGKL